MYQQMIREQLAQQGYIGQFDPRHVEAWMRQEHSTLDALSANQFASEVTAAVACVMESGSEISERLARCEGL